MQLHLEDHDFKDAQRMGAVIALLLAAGAEIPEGLEAPVAKNAEDFKLTQVEAHEAMLGVSVGTHEHRPAPMFNAEELAEAQSLPQPLPGQTLMDAFMAAPVTVDADQPQTAPVTLPPLPNATTTPALPPVPSVAAPTAPAAPTNPANAGTVELDKDALPWDARIHASTKTKNADGRWKKKRGISDEEIASVTDELRALMAVPTAPVAILPPPIVPATAGLPPTLPPIVLGSGVPPLPPVIDPNTGYVSAPLPPVVPAVPTPSAPASQPSELIAKVAKCFCFGHFNPSEWNAELAAVGLRFMQDLMQRPDLVPALEQRLYALLAAKGKALP